MRNLFSKKYLFAAALVAGTMGMTSCSNDEIDDPMANKESEVTIALSTTKASTKASSNDVNFGTTMQQIDNIIVVPMIGNSYQNPLKFGNFTPKTEEKVIKQTNTMSGLVSRFKVFGNVCDGYTLPAYTAIEEDKLFTGLTFTAPTWESDAPAGKPYSKPHELYYYYDTQDKGFQGSTQEWSTSEPTDWQTVQAVGNNKSIKISPVNYAVGVLAALIKNGDTETTFYNDEDCLNPIIDPWGKATDPITVTGITIAKQAQSFDADFKATGNVDVYETATEGKLGGNNVTGGSLNNTNRTGGNIYCIVAPTTEGTVTLNIEFKVAEGVYYKLQNEKVMKPGTKLYLPVVLDKDLATSSGTATNIFEADKATFLNATVKNWGIASETPVQTTDVTIGVEFDVTWGEGLTFDIEI